MLDCVVGGLDKGRNKYCAECAGITASASRATMCVDTELSTSLLVYNKYIRSQTIAEISVEMRKIITDLQDFRILDRISTQTCSDFRERCHYREDKDRAGVYVSPVV